MTRYALTTLSLLSFVLVGCAVTVSQSTDTADDPQPPPPTVQAPADREPEPAEPEPVEPDTAEPEPVEEPTEVEPTPAAGTGEIDPSRVTEHRCGGFAGLRCPPSHVCVDNPADGCDPMRGGRDCIGLCLSPAPAE